ncbi:unnamed protein product [Meloidogyne enterolobii]|uniref:Uncharacterized protein n=1 Tax=Meloidogyne enterolobii TaxID=390850 RepID=A0ACB0Z2T5_MELEN
MRNTRIGRFTRGYFCTTIVFHFLAFFFGAQIFSFDTFLFALLLTTTTFLPLNISCSESAEKFWNCWDNYPQTISQLYSIRVAFGSLIGSWIGVFVVPLDWNRWWQRWPICSVFGLFIFSLIGVLSAYFRLFTNYPINKAISIKNIFRII